jgi:hypothetical protein
MARISRGREVVGVRGGEPDARDAVDVVHALEQRREVGGRIEVASVGVHRLAEEGDLATTLGGELANLRRDGLRRMAAFPAPRGGHDAEGAVLLAALHHGDEGLEPRRAIRPRGELDQGPLARLEHGPALGPRAPHQLHHPRDGRRAEDEIHIRCPLLDALLLQLRHASHHADEQARSAPP